MRDGLPSRTFICLARAKQYSDVAVGVRAAVGTAEKATNSASLMAPTPSLIVSSLSIIFLTLIKASRSSSPARLFLAHQYRLDWRRRESDWNVYYSADFDMEGRLCGMLRSEQPPEHLYILTNHCGRRSRSARRSDARTAENGSAQTCSMNNVPK